MNELAQVRSLGAKRKDLAARLERVNVELREAIVAADAAAHTLPMIAEAAGMTKQRVHQIVAQAREAERVAARRARPVSRVTARPKRSPN